MFTGAENSHTTSVTFYFFSLVAITLKPILPANLQDTMQYV